MAPSMRPILFQFQSSIIAIFIANRKKQNIVASFGPVLVRLYLTRQDQHEGESIVRLGRKPDAFKS